MKKMTLFDANWLEEDQFKSWLTSAKDGNKARCKLCKKDIGLSNMGRQGLVSRWHGKKHKEVDVKLKTFFQSKKQTGRGCSKSGELGSKRPGTCSSKTQSSIELVINALEHSKAEILWTLKSLSAGYSNNSCSDNAGLFQHMFPDSEIAKSFQVGPSKIKYLTNFDVAPYYKSALLERIKESPCFVISCDETLNLMTLTCGMDLLARYFDETEEKVKIRYLDSQFHGHDTSNDLKKNINESLKVLDANKLIQVGMDGSNVSIKLLKVIQAERSENEQHQLIDVGS